MPSKSSSIDPMDLLNSAAQQGNLSGASMTVAQAILKSPDLGEMMRQALATPDDQLPAVQQTLLTVLIDDSRSILMSGNEQHVRDGANHFITSQQGGRYSGGILIGTFYLNGDVLNPYKPIKEAVLLTDQNYRPLGRTPLYDVTAATLLSVIAETEKLAQSGITVRTQTLIVSDGQDEHSVKCRAADVAEIARQMQQQESQNIIGAIGIGDYCDWNKVFGDMGILPQWILTVDATEKALRAAFDNASRTTANVMSQGYSQQAIAGGFGNP